MTDGGGHGCGPCLPAGGKAPLCPPSCVSEGTLGTQTLYEPLASCAARVLVTGPNPWGAFPHEQVSDPDRASYSSAQFSHASPTGQGLSPVRLPSRPRLQMPKVQIVTWASDQPVTAGSSRPFPWA